MSVKGRVGVGFVARGLGLALVLFWSGAGLAQTHAQPDQTVQGVPEIGAEGITESMAEISARNLSRARYDASYRVTGNFLDWVTRRYDKDLVKQLNALAREGKYTEAAWEEVTGKTLPELGDEWRQDLERRINGASEARLP